MGEFSEIIRSSKIPVYSNGDIKIVKQEQKLKCENCGSNNTICVYDYFSGCNTSVNINKEFYCKDCKHYTIFEYEYDS